jgi:hypothetical protein
VRQTWKFDRHGMYEDLRARLETLEKALRPVGLAEKVRAVVLGGSSAGFDLDDFALDDVEKALKQRDATAFELGLEIAQNPQVFAELLPAFVSSQGNLWPFGRGMGEGSKDPRVTWKDLGTAFAAAPGSHGRTLAFEGFLNGLHGKAPEVVDEILDESLTDECLGQKFPRLQAAILIDRRGVERLKQCLTLGLAQITEFEALSGGRATDPISGEDLQALISRIASKPEGALVALDILHMRLWSDAQQKKALSPELTQAGCDVLKRIEFKKNAQTLDHRLAQVAKLCLGSEAGNEAFQTVCENFKAAVTSYEVHASEHDDFLQALFEVRPLEALDAFVDGKGRLGTILLGTLGHDKNPLDAVSDDVLIEWCERDPPKRYPLVARIIAQFESDDKRSPVGWNSHALKLLDNAPDPVSVLKELVASLRPSSWQGSRASAMASRLPMIEELQQHPNPAVAEFARPRIVPGLSRKLKKKGARKRSGTRRRMRGLNEVSQRSVTGSALFDGFSTKSLFGLPGHAGELAAVMDSVGDFVSDNEMVLCFHGALHVVANGLAKRGRGNGVERSRADPFLSGIQRRY